MKKIKICSYSVSYAGRRTKNEDNVLIRVNKRTPGTYAVIMAVADGMGGYHNGGTASKMMAWQLNQIMKEKLPADPFKIRTIVEKQIKSVNQRIYERSQKVDNCRMGTTVSGAVLVNGECLFFNVGDSRTYLINDSGIRRITQDHSADMESFKKGIIAEHEIGKGLYSHALTRSIGTDPDVDIDFFPENGELHVLKEGEIIFSCSDGLWNIITEQEIFQEIRGRTSIEQSLEALATLAYMKNADDNISIAALEYGRMPRKVLKPGDFIPLKQLEKYKHLKKKTLLPTLLIIFSLAFLVVVGVLMLQLHRTGYFTEIDKHEKIIWPGYGSDKSYYNRSNHTPIPPQPLIESVQENHIEEHLSQQPVTIRIANKLDMETRKNILTNTQTITFEAGGINKIKIREHIKLLLSISDKGHPEVLKISGVDISPLNRFEEFLSNLNHKLRERFFIPPTCGGKPVRAEIWIDFKQGVINKKKIVLHR